MLKSSASAISRRQFVATSAMLALAQSAPRDGECSEPSIDTEKPVARDYENLRQLEGHEPLSLNTRKSALLIIDMQRYFVHRDYPLTQCWETINPGCLKDYFRRVTEVVIPNCQKLLSLFRTANTPVIYTAFGSLLEDGSDMPSWAREDNTLSLRVMGKPMYPPRSDPSWQVDESLAPRPEELIVAKSSSGPLNSTRLDQTLHILGIDSLVVTGVVTDVCVTQTAREFADRDFKVVVVEDACATVSDARHHYALETFADVFGHVMSTDGVLKALSS